MHPDSCLFDVVEAGLWFATVLQRFSVPVDMREVPTTQLYRSLSDDVAKLLMREGAKRAPGDRMDVY